MSVESMDSGLPEAVAAIDLTRCLTRIAKAGRAFEESSERVLQLEAQVHELTEQQTTMADQLAEAAARAAALEIALAIEEANASRAQALADATATRANQLEATAVETLEKLEALTAAITAAFDDIPEELGDIRVAA